jgi:hypothetical protein
MPGGKRNFIVGISLLLICIIVLGCLPNKQGGLSCVCGPLRDKTLSMPPEPKDATSSTPTPPPSQLPFAVGKVTQCNLGFEYHEYNQQGKETGNFETALPEIPLKGSFSGYTFKGSGSTKVGTITSMLEAIITLDQDLSSVSSFTVTKTNSGYSDDKITMIGGGIPLAARPDGSYYYGITGINTCGHITSLTREQSTPWISRLTKFSCNSYSYISISFAEAK